ncbi:RhoGAP domain-containing protein [Cavenderia fasciculata]|uniref:RhoGAP domain-containing protein n=1 Tax=Cavenderia fasciculata TaxID=261658 RepID=F4PQQ5_CACFS|nr:RhoGAP domain-containing protein [Cavenderia fasciculata]EGG22013.1 RhoGAP domain-containing protein [Cavenderia fasciculata]|eukprot:XP_004359864.1 RhoGAP domain-containing protein [Cavenderia fasciculata]
MKKEEEDKIDTIGCNILKREMRRVKSFLRKETKGNLKYSVGWGGSKKLVLDPNDPIIPDVLVLTTKYIEERGLSEQGLFRVSGNAAEINKIRSLLDKGETFDFSTASTPHVVTGILKHYLRELPEPLFTFGFYDALIASYGVTDPTSRLSYFLIAFLYRICKHSRTHKMDSGNLSIVFAPNILRAKVETPEQIVADSPKVTTIIKLIIEHYQELFEKDPFTGDYLDFETRPFNELFEDDYVSIYETINLDKEIAAIYEEEVDIILQKATKPNIYDMFSPPTGEVDDNMTPSSSSNNANNISIDESEPPSLYFDDAQIVPTASSSLLAQQHHQHRLSIKSNSSSQDSISSPDISIDCGNTMTNGQQLSSPPTITITTTSPSQFCVSSPTSVRSVSPRGNNGDSRINIGIGRNAVTSDSEEEENDHLGQGDRLTLTTSGGGLNNDNKIMAIKKLVDDSIIRLENEFQQLSEEFKQNLTIQEILLIASSMKNIMNVIKEGPDVDFKVVSALNMDMDMTLFTSENEQVKRLETLRAAILHKTTRLPAYLEQFKEEAEMLVTEGNQVDLEVCLGGLIRIMRTLKAVGDILDFFYSKWRGEDESDQSSVGNTDSAVSSTTTKSTDSSSNSTHHQNNVDGSSSSSRDDNVSAALNIVDDEKRQLHNQLQQYQQKVTDEKDIAKRLGEVDSVMNDIEESLIRITSKSELVYIAKIIQNLHKITKMPLNATATFDDIPPPKINTLKVTPKQKLAALISVVYVLIKEIRDDIKQLKSNIGETAKDEDATAADTAELLKQYDTRINDINKLLERTPSHARIMNGQNNLSLIIQNQLNNNNNNSNNNTTTTTTTTTTSSSSSSSSLTININGNGGNYLTGSLTPPKLSSSPISGLGGSTLLGKVLFDQLANTQNITNMRNILLLLLSCSTTITQVQSQSLSTDELNSCIYLITQYGSNIAQNSASICSSGQFTCGIGSDNNYHVLQIAFDNIIYQPSGTPPSITELTFPEATNIKIRASIYTYFDWSKDILVLFKNLPKLTVLDIGQDSTIKAIPPNFSLAMPKLTRFYLGGANNLTSINFSSFNNSLLEKFETHDGGTTTLVIANDLYLPRLLGLSIFLKSAPASTIVFNSRSFPVLTSVYFMSRFGSERVNLQLNLPLTIFLGQMMDVDQTGYFAPSFMYPKVLTSLALGGRNFIPIDITPFTALINLEVQFSLITSYPWSFYPPTLEFLQLANNRLTSIPTMAFPKNVFSVNLSENRLSGTIPISILANKPKKMNFQIGGNQNITGNLGEEWCSINGLYIQNTGITSIPDCWWCYSSSNYLQTSLFPPNPSTLQCNVSVDSTSLLSKAGYVTIVGQNLGWAVNIPNARLLVPNKEILYKVNLTSGGFQQNITVSLIDPPKPEFTFNFTTKEVGFETLSMSGQSSSIDIWYYNVTFKYWIDEFLPVITMNNNIPCLSPVYYNNTKSITFYFSYPPVGQQSITMNNQYHSSFYYALITRPIYMSSYLMDPIYPPAGINMYGYFGDATLEDGYVTLSWGQDITFCNFTSINSTFIRCKFVSVASPGDKTLSLKLNFVQAGVAYLVFPTAPSSYVDCMNRTNRCNGRGSCVDGQCVCDPGWTDDCKLQSVLAPNVDFIKNGEVPSAVFSYGDYLFAFNMISIQELDIDDNIINQLDTLNWTYVDKSTPTLTSVAYQLVKAPEVASNFTLLNVVSLIEFSDQPRTVQFAGDDIQLGAGSIKISVEITNWPFNTTISHLRVVFSTKINNEQFVVGCDNSNVAIESLQNALSGDSLQYLRVVQGNVQFFGRFLDYSVGDGRKVSSIAQVLNVTKIDDKESLATIGINLPICQVCLLDPDFSALIVDRDSYGSCEKDGNNNWKVIVGVVVGVVGALALGIIIFALVKRNRFFFIRRKKNESSIDLQSRKL